ncbi:hypothetical protein ES703_121881 [subsurface metagenome]
MADKAWKAFERRVAKSLGTVRTPLSGISSRHTSSDTLHPDLYVECKMRKRSLVHTLFTLASKQAKVERKIPVMAMHVARSHTTIAIIDWDFFLQLWHTHTNWPLGRLDDERSDP